MRSFFGDDASNFEGYNNMLNASITRLYAEHFNKNLLEKIPGLKNYTVEDAFSILNVTIQEFMNKRINHDFSTNSNIDIEKYYNDLSYQNEKINKIFGVITEYFGTSRDFYDDNVKGILDKNLEDSVKSISALTELKSKVSNEDYEKYYNMMSSNGSILNMKDEILQKYGIDIELSNIGKFDIAYNLITNAKSIVNEEDYQKCIDLVSSKEKGIDIREGKDMIMFLSNKYPDFKFERKTSVFEELTEDEFRKRYDNEYQNYEFDNSDIYSYINENIFSKVRLNSSTNKEKLDLSSMVATEEEVIKAQLTRENEDNKRDARCYNDKQNR